MTQPAKSQEPSMEEILASIRRIIADDDASKSVPRPAEAAKLAPRPMSPPAPRIMPEPVSPAMHVNAAIAEPISPAAFDEPGEEEGSDILDLTESMAAPAFEPPLPPAPSHLLFGKQHSEAQIVRQLGPA